MFIFYVIPLVLLFALLALSKLPTDMLTFHDQIERWSSGITVLLMIYVFIMAFASQAMIWFFLLDLILVPLIMIFAGEDFIFTGSKIKLRKMLNKLFLAAISLSIFIILNRFWFKILLVDFRTGGIVEFQK